MDGCIETSSLVAESTKMYGSLSSSREYINRPQGDFSLFSTLAQKLHYHKELFGHRRFFASFSLLFALFGLSLAVILTEITIHFSRIQQSRDLFVVYTIIKWSITVTTLILLVLIVIYHQVDLRIEMQRHKIQHWQLAINTRRSVKIVSELLICAIHPFPFTFIQGFNNHRSIHGSNSSLTNNSIAAPAVVNLNHTRSYSSLNTVDGITSLLMFMRMYLLARVLILRSTLYHDASAQSFSAINRTALNTKFIFKSWMNLYAGYVLTVIIFVIFVWGSWSIRVCEMFESGFFLSFADSMWLTAVTFLSIGYGDLVPYTICGKFVAIMIGALGAGCTAIVVAIVASKLELSQSERCLHNFMQDCQLSARVRHVSADIVKCAWRLYRQGRTQASNSSGGSFSGNKLSVHHRHGLLPLKRRLLAHVREIREIRLERRHLSDNTVSLLDVNRSQTECRESLDKLAEQMDRVESTLKDVSVHILQPQQQH